MFDAIPRPEPDPSPHPEPDQVQQLVSLAWEQRQFECCFPGDGGEGDGKADGEGGEGDGESGEGGERVFEASVAVVTQISEGATILIARTLTLTLTLTLTIPLTLTLTPTLTFRRL